VLVCLGGGGILGGFEGHDVVALGVVKSGPGTAVGFTGGFHLNDLIASDGIDGFEQIGNFEKDYGFAREG
jgi:hypothetical protein